MAKKKPRTPGPPRRVQAPQQRKATPSRTFGSGNRPLLYAIAGAGAVVLVAVVVAVAAFGGGGGGKGVSERQVAAAMSAATCSFRTVNAYVPHNQTHVDSLTKKFPWNTDPPSNGQHYPEWAVWGFYTSPVNPRMVVHNEEHGGVILWWGPQVPQSTVEQLRSFYNEEPTGSFGTPYASLGGKIAITAWTGDPVKYRVNGYYGQGHIGICPSYTAATKTAFTDFRKLYRGHGPEGIPLSSDVPGLGP